MSKFVTLLGTAAMAAVALAGGPAIAEYPEKPVEFIVPWPPGDLEDVLTRMIAEDFQAKYGVPAAVVNKPGGSGGPFPGAVEVANAQADGYSIGSFVIGVPVVGPNIGIPELSPNPFEPLGIFLTYPFVIVAGGDGDGFSIGGNHFLHTCRRNPDITYVVMDNQVYGLTKGQVAPNSPAGFRAGTTPQGSVEAPVNPLAMVIASGATFAARGFAGNPKQLKEIYKAAIQHRGFAFVDVLSPCPTFNQDMTYQTLRPQVEDLPEDHDTTDPGAAYTQAMSAVPKIGIFVQIKESVPYEDRLAAVRSKMIEYDGRGDLQGLIDSFK